VSGRRVVVAGFGDSGVLTAVHLSRHADVVGISAKPGLVSGQELGMRVSRPDAWAREYRVAFDRFRRLDGVRTVHGLLTAADLAARTVTVERDGTETTEPYDVLVIATGVTNGFWRGRPRLQSDDDIDAELRDAHERVAKAASVVVIGGGAAAVNSAFNVAATWPDKRVDLYFPGERPLPQHHGRVWAHVHRRMVALGVGLHPGHRAVVPAGFGCDDITAEPVEFTHGPAVTADAVIWAVGRTRPNTGWLPPEILDEHGFVRVDADLRVPGQPDVFAVGDVAATDPLRSSARNRADKLVAHNVRARFDGRPLRTFRAPRRRWGSVLGFQENGIHIFAPDGWAFRFPAWSVHTVLQPWIVRRGIYRGVRGPRRAR
jgi:NADH dehydrogenase FAD-containing subunit